MDGDGLAIASSGFKINRVLSAMSERVDLELATVGSDGAGELCLVQVEAEIGSGDLALGADLEAAKG